MKLARYHAQQSGQTWLVLDRHKIRLHNDVVMTCRTRDEARAKARELNSENRQDLVDNDARDGETI